MRTSMLVVAAALAMPAQAWQKPYVELTTPEAWAALEQDRPAHFRAAEDVIRTAQVETCETLPKILKVRLALDDVQCSSYQLLTSLPPKRRLTFSLDGITYAMFAPMYRLAPARSVPALEPPAPSE